MRRGDATINRGGGDTLGVAVAFPFFETKSGNGEFSFFIFPFLSKSHTEAPVLGGARKDQGRVGRRPGGLRVRRAAPEGSRGVAPGRTKGALGGARED